MTAQFSDSLVFEGRTFSLDCEPLHDWLARKKNRQIRFKRTNTAHTRGYWSRWAVHRGRLYLTHFSGRLPNGRFAGFRTLFENYSDQFYLDCRANHPDNDGPGKFAFWFDGWLSCHFGDRIRYEHSPYQSVYEGELHLLFKGGFLMGQRIVRNRPSIAAESERHPIALCKHFTAEEIEELLADDALLEAARLRARTGRQSV